jgi:hypothetical protein
MLSILLPQGTPVFNAPTLSAKGLLQFAQGVLVLRKQYRNMLSPPMFDSPRAIRSVFAFCCLLLEVVEAAWNFLVGFGLDGADIYM